jgi:hypothetical protein
MGFCEVGLHVVGGCVATDVISHYAGDSSGKGELADPQRDRDHAREGRHDGRLFSGVPGCLGVLMRSEFLVGTCRKGKSPVAERAR